MTCSLVAVRGLLAAATSPLGYQPDGVAVASYDAGFVGLDEARANLFHAQVFERIASLPGVRSAAFASSVPLSIDQSTATVYAGGTVEFSNRNRRIVSYYYVSPGYFRTIGTHLLDGPDFTPRDRPDTPAVAIVNRTFAKTVVGTPDAVGRRFLRGQRQLHEIVGVVKTASTKRSPNRQKPPYSSRFCKIPHASP